MNQILPRHFIPTLIISLFVVFSNNLFAQSALDCQRCHQAEFAGSLKSAHSYTQMDVASELSTNDVGKSPNQVIQDEDCVACHGPVAVALNGGMSESQVMADFFTTTGGLFTSSTVAKDSLNWPNVNCVTCHNVPSDHFVSMPTLSVFNSQTAKYDSAQSSSILCGQCHGTLHFPSTDHRIYDAWKMSKHGHGGQFDVAGELSANDTGETPDQIVKDEDCIGCHAPTSVVVNTNIGPSIITEGQALANFFTTSGGKITSATVPQDTADYPNVACIACHDPHDPGKLSYFNSATGTYEGMSSPDSLCGQCHGNLRFPGTDHISYNFLKGESGVGVQSQVSMDGKPTCIDCHMHKSDTDGLNSTMYEGHSWQVFVKEPDGSITTSCTTCHTTMSADSAMAIVDIWKSQFAQLDSTAEADVVLADTFMTTHADDSLKAQYLAEATQNMTVAEDDESGGVHNHNYSVALLNDAIAKSQFIVTGIKPTAPEVAIKFQLMQNYPNPFNPTTTIAYEVAKTSDVTVAVYNVLGEKVATLVNERMSPGEYRVQFDGSRFASGVYFYAIRARGADGELFQAVKKMLMVK